MLGLVLSLVVSAAPAMPSAGVTCPEGPATCDGAWVAVAAAASTPVSEGPRDYATPAEVDCPAPGDGPIAGGECENVPLDLWYRVSRLPDSERPNGALAPEPRHARTARGSSCNSVPADPARVAAPDVQPLALFALPHVAPALERALPPQRARALPARGLAPPDRPPRA
jgi:hypothetical protein